MLEHYLTTALRQFRRHTLTTLINVAGLSIGLVCFVVAYASVIYLQAGERGFPKASRTFVISMSFLGRGSDTGAAAVTMPMTPSVLAKYLRTDVPELDGVARATGGVLLSNEGFEITAGDKTSRAYLTFVDADFLSIFDLPFVSGDASALRQPDSAVLTEKTANLLFGTRSVVGRRVRLVGREVTITGVIKAIPPPSHLADSPTSLMRSDVLVSMNVYEQTIEKAVQSSVPNADPNAENWVVNTHVTYALLPENGSLTPAQLNARLESFAERRVPKDSLKVRFAAKPVSEFLMSLTDIVLGSTTAMLLALGGMVLVVACLNYANLATAQGANRAREVGMRKILGARRSQVILQYLFESALHTSAALVTVLVAIALVLPVLRAAAGIDLLPILMSSVAFWTFLAGIVVAVSILAGAYPAFALSRLRPIQALRAGRIKVGLRFAPSLLVSIQFAVASVLLIAVIVMHFQNQELRRTAFGSTRDPIVAITNRLTGTGVSIDALRAELLRSPQITSVSTTAILPWQVAIAPTSVSRSMDASATEIAIGNNIVGHDFFSTMNMRLAAGRVFDKEHSEDLLPTGSDASRSRAYNVVVDRAGAAVLGWSDPQKAIGQTVYLPWLTNASRPPDHVRIIGVIENKPLGLLGPGNVKSNLYRLSPPEALYPIIRISGKDIPGAVAAVDTAWQRLAPNVQLRRRFGDELFEQGYRLFDAINQIFTGLTAFAFVISIMGLFGMAIHVTSGRTHEIGIRKTLGASVERVVSLLLWDFSKPVAIANLVAWPIGFLAMRMYLNLFFDRIALTPGPFVLSLIVTVLIAWFSVGVQTLRAARRKPAAVLRYE